ncbi:uncharacterized protein LOC103141723 isoform X2 [Poecilia formosa]|uniref:uncharacterized protein LOC103141723 isoform X2 n=1 Tax=Poecilia formosa TaxID=48698 RepID=UPI0007B9E459|nr:PREDICTED: uncharacterized protein LOC103141723 isoform X2 [Poecilia formosa]
MDDFVCDKLTQWGLNEEMDMESLYCLEDQDVDTLIPNVDQRTQFKKGFQLLKEEQSRNPRTQHCPAQCYINSVSEQCPTRDDSRSIRSLSSSSPGRPRERLLTANNVTSDPARTSIKSLSTVTVSVGLLNIRSLTNKESFVSRLLREKQFDFLCLTETWQKKNDLTHVNRAAPDGYSHISQPRSGRGGGVAVLFREKWLVSPVSVPTYNSFESIVLQIHLSVPTILATIYRPPEPNKAFLSDFSSLLTFLWSLSPNIIVVGDFNIHMDKFSKTLTRDFYYLLDDFGMQQYVDFSTHSQGHILDLVCCSALTLSSCTALEMPICDHKLISFTVTLPLFSLVSSSSKRQ